MGILALIAEFENDIRRERQMDGMPRLKKGGRGAAPKPQLTAERVKEIRTLRKDGARCQRLCATPSSASRSTGLWVLPKVGVSRCASLRNAVRIMRQARDASYSPAHPALDTRMRRRPFL